MTTDWSFLCVFKFLTYLSEMSGIVSLAGHVTAAANDKSFRAKSVAALSCSRAEQRNVGTTFTIILCARFAYTDLSVERKLPRPQQKLSFKSDVWKSFGFTVSR